ncbi:MAG TPA: CHAT domain-containing protein [Thermoanaerobaculia bacterium]|jgi:CHAT domain-containing protein
MKANHQDFPSDETLAAFIDGRLDPETRRQVIEHMASCDECYAVFQSASEFHASEMPAAGPPAIDPRFGWRPSARLVALASSFAAAAVLVILFWQPLRNRFGGGDAGMDRLITASGPLQFRSVEPRLSADLPYKRLRRVTRGPAATGSHVNEPAYWPLFAYAAELGERTKKKPTVEGLHALGLSHLLVDSHDQAVQTLEAAIRLETGIEETPRAIAASDDADLLVDLSAAYYSRQQPESIAAAAETSLRAVKIAPDNAAAWYAHALNLQALHLREDAIEAWQRYLQLDPSSAWATEARLHLNRLRGGAPSADFDGGQLDRFAEAANREELTLIAREFPQQTRVRVEEELLVAWAKAILRGDRDAATKSLDGARVVAEALHAAHGDATLRDTVAAVSSNPSLETARAHLAYREARVLFKTATDERARLALTEAATRLERAGSPLALRAWVYAATTAHYLGDNAGALQIIERIEKNLTAAPPLYSVRGQASWTRGIILHATGAPEQALDAFIASERLLRLSGEMSNLSGVEAALASSYRYLGMDDEAWRRSLNALAAASNGATYERLQVASSGAARAALRLGYMELAKLLGERVRDRARKKADRTFVCDANVLLGSALMRQRRHRDALEVFDTAEREIEGASDSGTKWRLKADVELSRAAAMLEFDAAGAERLLTRALAVFEKLNNESRAPHAYLLRGRARAKLHDYAHAEEDFGIGITVLMTQRVNMANPEARSTLTDTGRELFDAMIALLVDSGRSDEALAFVRSARLSGLADPQPFRTREPARDGLAPSRSLPPVTITYHVLPDALLTWTQANGRATFHQQHIARTALRRQVHEAVVAIRDAQTKHDSLPATAALYDLLIRPVATSLPYGAPLAIAPDGFLYNVPFPALRDAVTNRYLADPHPLTILIGSRTEPRSAWPPAHEPSVLVVLPGAGSELPMLHHAKAEANAIESAFPRTTVLAEDRATPDRFLADAPRYDAIHFAGHTRNGGDGSALASLVFASPVAGQEEGRLYASRVASASFDRVGLVVLASCDTAAGRLSSAGPLGLTSSFVTAGVPRVVSSLWPADDAVSAALFTEFYTHLAAGSPPDRALQAAQAMLRDTAPPQHWATFQLFAPQTF